MSTQSLITRLKAAKAYCREQNGRDDCKNCGMEHWDEIVAALKAGKKLAESVANVPDYPTSLAAAMKADALVTYYAAIQDLSKE